MQDHSSRTLLFFFFIYHLTMRKQVVLALRDARCCYTRRIKRVSLIGTSAEKKKKKEHIYMQAQGISVRERESEKHIAPVLSNSFTLCRLLHTNGRSSTAKSNASNSLGKQRRKKQLVFFLIFFCSLAYVSSSLLESENNNNNKKESKIVRRCLLCKKVHRESDTLQQTLLLV